MKKVLCLLIVFSIFIVLLTSQIVAKDTKIVVTPQLIGNPDAKTTITWLPKDGLDIPNEAVASYLTRRAKEWAEKHPDVKIVPQAQTLNIQNAMAKLSMQIASGNAPDLVAIDSFTVSKYYQYLQPLDSILKEEKLSLKSWFPFAQKVMKPKNKILAMFFTTDVRLFYYRKDLISQPPRTWDEVLSIGKEMSNKGYIGLLYPAGKNETTMCNFWPHFWSQGGSLVDSNGKPVFAKGKNKTYMLNALDFIKATVDTGISPRRVISFTADSNMNADIASGKVAMFQGGNWLAKQVSDIIGADNFNKMWEMTTIPVKKGAKTMTTSGGWVTGVLTKDPQKQKLAADFAIHMYINDAGMTGYCSSYGLLPPRKTLFEKPIFKNNHMYQVSKTLLETAKVRPGETVYNTISQQFQTGLSGMISDSATPEEVLNNVWNSVKSSQ
jgi:multiple sugar transport system substrate-binding protein